MSSLLPDSIRDQEAPPRALVEALRDEPFEPARIESAYARFLRKRAAAPTQWRGPRFVRHAAFAVVMAVGTVYAATLIQPLTGGLQPTATLPPADIPSSSPRTASAPRDATQRQESEPEALVPEAVVPSPAVSAPAAPVRGQAVRNSPSPVPSAKQWKRAAQGLRDGDYQSADAALKELRRSGTEADRESALLVQAQVLLAQGREAEAQRLLKSLESARAPSVRRKSVELLARLRDRPTTRSDKGRGAAGAP